MINITYHNGLEQYIYFGPRPYGEPIPKPPVEPGMEVILESNGTHQRSLVERIEYEKHLGHLPEWVAITSDSKRIHLNLGLELQASWPEGGLQPYFRKDHEFYLPDKAGNLVRHRVLTQSSLDDSARVYFVNVEGGLFRRFLVYRVPLSKLQDMLDSLHSHASSSRPEEFSVPVRHHRKR